MRSLPALVRNHLAALRMLLVFTVITGIAYPLLVTGVAQAAFSGQANGSLVTN
ncbi:MAG: potassium-transporting ATPase KdpC subunit, partial [Streptomyces sp.]|nr:potassium-transporting ATPase KdpC subunit [Streptomyces sp.]